MLAVTQRLSNKKAKLIKAYQEQVLQAGDRVEAMYNRGYGKDEKKSFKVISVTENTVIVSELGYTKPNPIELDIAKIISKYTGDIGAQPFSLYADRLQHLQYGLDSIFYDLGLLQSDDESNRSTDTVNGVYIPRSNFNPYVRDANSNKQYFQRDLVWKLKDKQLLIESLYNGTDCGTILVKPYSYSYIEKAVSNGDTELAWHDVIDGKQRLNALMEFFCGGFKDLSGNYWGDLSDNAQEKLMSTQQFKYTLLPEDCTDKATLSQFLRLNYAGVPQSKEHLKKISDLLKSD